MTEHPSRNCEKIEPLLSAYVLEELEGVERTDVATHITTCEKCREEAAILSSTAALVAKSAPAESRLGPSERGKIIAAAQTPKAARKNFLRWAGGIAAAALLVVGITAFVIDLQPRGKLKKAGEDPLAQKEIALAPARPVQEELEELAAVRLDTAPQRVEGAPGVGAGSSTDRGIELPRGSALQIENLSNRNVELARNDSLLMEKKSELIMAHSFQDRDAAALKDVRREAGLAAGKPAELAVVDGAQESANHQFFYASKAERGAATDAAKTAESSRRLTKASESMKSLEYSFKSPEETRGIFQRVTDGLSVDKKGSAGTSTRRMRTLGVSIETELAQAGGANGAQTFGEAGGRAAPDKAPVASKAGAAAAKPAVELPAADATNLTRQALDDVRPFPPGLPAGRQSVDEGLQAKTKGGIDGGVRAKDSPEKKSLARAGDPPVPGKAGRPAAPAEAPGVVPASKGPPALPPGVVTAGAVPAPSPVQVSVPATSAPAPDWKARVDDFLSRLDRKPGETPDMMFFRYWGDNPFVEASSDSFSTFAVDVDTASYTLTRSYLYKQGVLPPREAIRTEECINYFKGHYPSPASDGPAFAIHTEIAASPFGHEAEYRLLRVGIKGREVSREKRKACSLVFVIDTSGSMRRENRLELVKEALKLLVKELDEGDTVGIVAFDREARTVLEPAPASEKERILDAIATLEPRQNTNVAAGLELGYKMAGSRLLKDGSNRVILLSDGVANTGILDVNTMLEQIRSQRERGVYLTTVGVGMGNLNDTLLEQLADRGNGQCVYVDRVEEAKKAFADNLVGTLETIARDVKIQVELDPTKVLRYRLLGYENRAIADSAFRDNTVDAGEVGAGHEVTALYELKLKPDAAASSPGTGKLATVRVRYLTVDHGEAQEIEKTVDSSAAKTAFAEASPRFRLHACVGEFAEVLRDSYWARGSSLDRVASMLGDILDLRESEGGPRIGEDQDVVELVALVKKADALVRLRAADTDDVARTVDAIKDNIYLSARVEDEVRARGEQNRSQLDEIRRQNDELRRRLESLLAR